MAREDDYYHNSEVRWSFFKGFVFGIATTLLVAFGANWFFGYILAGRMPWE